MGNTITKKPAAEEYAVYADDVCKSFSQDKDICDQNAKMVRKHFDGPRDHMSITTYGNLAYLSLYASSSREVYVRTWEHVFS